MDVTISNDYLKFVAFVYTESYCVVFWEEEKSVTAVSCDKITSED